MIETLVSLAAFGALAGAIAGSFLNVAIHRLPLLIGDDRRPSPVDFLRSLAWPASHCPRCKHSLGWRDNIPILSYVVLRGRCRSCKEQYGVRYLAVELLSAAAVAACAVNFGLTLLMVCASAFALGLIALTFIDIEEQLLPDALVFPLLGLGLLYNGFVGQGWLSALYGACAGFAVLWTIRAAYRAYSGIEGLGFGDLKLAAAIGAWLGVGAVPAVLFIAFASGVVFMAPLLLSGRIDQKTPVPFGPFLAISGLCVLALPPLASFPMSLFSPY